jgi:hypothetical protein
MAFGRRESIFNENGDDIIQYSISLRYLFSVFGVIYPDLTYDELYKIVDEFTIHGLLMDKLKNVIDQQYQKR